MVDVEARVREAHGRGDMSGAVEEALRHYQTEIYSFLCARLGSESDAHDVLSQFHEDVWRGITTFRWQCSCRTWLYTLARHAALRFERSPANQAARRRSLSALEQAAAKQRSRTRPYLRTDAKERFAALRASLSPDEQSLLVLRVDRALSWDEVARVLHDDCGADEESVRRHATNLRQRFRQLTKRLRQRAAADGLLDGDGGSG